MVFDELAPDTTGTAKVAYTVNVFLFYAIFVSVPLGVVSVAAGVILLFWRLWSGRK